MCKYSDGPNKATFYLTRSVISLPLFVSAMKKIVSASQRNTWKTNSRFPEMYLDIIHKIEALSSRLDHVKLLKKDLWLCDRCFKLAVWTLFIAKFTG